MLARPATRSFNGDAWFFEIKWDGVRAIAYVGDVLSLRSRNDQELAGQFPELAELSHIAPGTVLDGEIVVMNRGRPDIQALLPRLKTGTGRSPGPEKKDPVTYIVFDILEKGGRSLTSLPLIERRKILEQSVTESPHVTLSVPVEIRGEDYYNAAIAKGLEGIMAKRKDSIYEPGVRSASWLKIKEQKTCDCVIAGYTQGQGGRDTSFGALILGLYETGTDDISPPGNSTRSTRKLSPESQKTGNSGKRLVYIGKVGTGFSDRDLVDLMGAFAKLKTSTPSVNPGELPATVIWLEPVLVCEVAYQEVTRERRLRIPRFVRIRSDKKPEECTTDQLEKVRVGPEPVRKKESYFSGEQSTGTGDEPMKEEKKKKNQPTGASHEPALEKYLEKRDFSVTGEPEGLTSPPGAGNYFVIQEHHSRRLHFDLRLERDGVLKSWAVPKGIPELPGEKHLAVAVEDHPLDYGHFEGTIPQGEYGAGTVSIWDNGTYDTKHWDGDKIEVTLHGRRLNGPYVLVTFKRAGKNEWLVFRSA
jgi:DNA ligase D-like protein (predicted 3'-phosphoesterase)